MLFSYSIKNLNIIIGDSQKTKYHSVNEIDSKSFRKKLLISFDDGYEDNFFIADKILRFFYLKGVVFISISYKLLFRSGSYTVTSRAKEVLGKVARVINDKTDLEFMVEGHTDNVPVKKDSNILLDNWDLSVKRATAVVRILQNDFLVDPARMTAAGRSSYVPLEDNGTLNGRAKNRRTRIVVLPKLDQFFDLLEKGMEAASK